MRKPGYQRLRKLAHDASKETGITFDVQMVAKGTHKGTVQYQYIIWQLGRYEMPVTMTGSPASVEAQFTAQLAKFREARLPEA